MNKKSILLLGVISALLLSLSVSFNSCDKAEKAKSLVFYITNPFDFDVKVFGMLEGCGYGPEDCVLSSGEEKMFKASTPEGNIDVDNYLTKKSVSLKIFYEDMHGTYTWTIGDDNPFVKVDDDYNGSNNGGGNNNGGNNNGSGQSIVFYTLDNVDECESVEVTVFTGFGAGGYPKDPIVKTFKGTVKLPYDVDRDVHCGMTGAATFDLPPGDYYYQHTTFNCYSTHERHYNWHTFTLKEGECVKRSLER